MKPVTAIVRNFFAFWGLFGRILRHLGFLGRFFLIFLDFSSVFGGFREDLGKIFRRFFDIVSCVVCFIVV